MKKLIAIILSMAFIVCTAGCGGETGATKESGQTHAEHEGFAISLARYPDQAVYPNEEDFIGKDGIFDDEGWEKVYEPYSQQTQQRREALKGYNGALDDYFKKAITTFLGGNDGENCICSPVNVFAATAMLAEVTDGESRAQLLSALGIKDMEQLRALAAAIWNGTYQDDVAAKCLSANSFWLRDDMNYKEDTLQILRDKYYASAFAGKMSDPAYTKALQDWINEQTGGLLKEQAGGLELAPETICALVSTLYFKGKWAEEFLSGQTASETFHAKSGDITHDFMHQSIEGTYFFGEKFGAIVKGFEGSDISMWFILPDEGTDAEALLQDDETLSFLIDRDKEGRENSKRLMINMAVPKFDVNSDLNLNEAFKKLGIENVFELDRSDFSPLTDDTAVYLSQIKHAARVKIDEEGCEAAAFTAMMAEGAAMPPEEQIDFVLDRPFVFAITAGTAQLPLFVGVVNQP